MQPVFYKLILNKLVEPPIPQDVTTSREVVLLVFHPPNVINSSAFAVLACAAKAFHRRLGGPTSGSTEDVRVHGECLSLERLRENSPDEFYFETRRKRNKAKHLRGTTKKRANQEPNNPVKFGWTFAVSRR